MAVGFSQHVKALRDTRIMVMVRQSPRRNSEYEADIIVNGEDFGGTGGLLDKKEIIDYIKAALQYAQADVVFLANASTEEAKKHYLNQLLLDLEVALAHTLAYEVAKD